MPGIANCDALILLGYHAMAGTPEAILEHTMSSIAWQNFWLNGEPAGEIAIDSSIAADHGVPTIMVSGDDKACKEALARIPGVVAVEVKKGLDVEGGILLPPERAHESIAAGAVEAIRKIESIKPVRSTPPVEMKLELVSRGRVPFNRPEVHQIDGRSYSVSANSQTRPGGH